MSVRLDIRGDTKAVLKDMEKLTKKEIPRATVTALNRTGNAVMSRTARSVARQTKVKAKTIRKRMPKQRANKRTMSFKFRTFTQGIPVHSQFTPTQLSSNIKTRRARVQGKYGVKWRGTTFPGSFVATPRRGGKPVVIQRKGQSRYPTKTVTVEVQNTFNRTAKRMTGLVGPKIFRKEFRNSAKFILSKRR